MKKCEFCEKEISPYLPSKTRFCSNACRLREWRLNNLPEKKEVYLKIRFDIREYNNRGKKEKEKKEKKSFSNNNTFNNTILLTTTRNEDVNKELKVSKEGFPSKPIISYIYDNPPSNLVFIPKKKDVPIISADKIRLRGKDE